MDPYTILGINRNASIDEAKKAYKKLAMKYHPDRNQDDPSTAEIEFKRIKNAYEEITNPPKKPNSFSFKDHDFDFSRRATVDVHDFINKMKREQEYADTLQIKIKLMLSFKDAVNGCTKYVMVPIGYASNTQNEKFEITVPPGIVNGDTVRYPKLIYGGPDLLVTFVINSSTEWAIDGRNLIKNVDISIWDLLTGTVLDVSLIDDSVIRLKIPPETNPGTFMRVLKKGLPSRGRTEVAGDMLIRLDGKFPKDIPPGILLAIKKKSS